MLLILIPFLKLNLIEACFFQFEVKHHLENLDKRASQLERYYTVTEILANGIEYRFISDMDKQNKMDTNPFLVINLLDLKDREIKELKRFIKENLDVDKILNYGN